MPNSHGPHARKPFRLNLLGGAALLDREARSLGQQRRRIALLALVASAGARGISRDRLMALLSPESATDSARHALQQLLYYLRQQAGEELFLGTDPLSLNTAVLTTDIGDFETALEHQAYGDAAVLYQGPFLDGFHLGDSPEFEEWVAAERARLQARYATALHQLARDAEERGDSHAAIDWWRRLATLDPLDGRAALGLIRALAAAGDTPGAVRHARTHGALVQGELGREPDPGIRAFVEGLPLNAGTREVEGGPMAPVLTSVPRRRMAWLVIGLATAFVVAVLALGTARSPRVKETALGRLAVLPLVNGSSDTTVAGITEALTQELISSLARAGMSVIGYYSVERYRRSRPPVAQIGRELGVDAVATWTIIQQADGWRVSLEVSRARSGEGLWASTRYLVDSLRLGDVADRTSRELVARFGPGRARRMGPPPRLAGPGTAEAKLAYLVGMDRLTRGSEGAQFSRTQFERAIALDSSFAPAHAGLAYSLMYGIDYGILNVREACGRAAPAAAHALSLDPELALAHLAHARVLHQCEWRWGEADEGYRRALALEPTANLYSNYGWFLSWYLGRFREGVALADTALALDPMSYLMHVARGWRLLAAGDLDQAEAEARAGIALESRSLDGPWILAEVYVQRGDLVAAEREAMLLKDHPAAVPANWSMLGEIYARSGRSGEARAYVALLGETRPMTGAARIAIARTQLALGDRDAALTTLERAVDDAIFVIPHQPYWTPIRGHERFRALMVRMGL